MPPGENRSISNSILQSEIKGLGNQIEDVKKLLVNYEERTRCLERAGDSTRPVYEKRIELLEKIAEEHDEELKSLKELINTQAQSIGNLKHSVDTMQKVWKWGLGIFTAVTVAVIIMLVTGQAMVVFK
jgi:predicted RNase H-like nuclease (RuvC/YqgF family)